MLMAFSCSGLPSSVTLPVTEPVVEAATILPAGAAVAAGCSAVWLLSLLPQPVMTRARIAARARCENLLLILENSSLAELRILTRLGTDDAGFLLRCRTALRVPRFTFSDSLGLGQKQIPHPLCGFGMTTGCRRRRSGNGKPDAARSQKTGPAAAESKSTAKSRRDAGATNGN